MASFNNTLLGEYAQRLTGLKGQEDRTFKLVLDNKLIIDLIKFLNTEDQMGQDHVDALGNQLFNVFTSRSFYSQNDPKGRAGEPYELFDTGSYWDSFLATVNAGNIVITSNPFKGSDNIEDAFGTNLEGLTDENLQVLINEALEQYINWYRKNVLP